MYKGDPNGSLQWYGTAASGYTNRYEKKTNTTANDWSDLIHLIDKINNTPSQNFRDSLEVVMNTQSFLELWASNILFSNLDSYQGSGHNYYLYRDSVLQRLFHFIVWDVNEAFGNFRMSLSLTQIENLSTFYLPSPANSRPLEDKMLQNVLYKQALADLMCTYLSGDFDPDNWIFGHIDSLKIVIQPHVFADTNSAYTNQMFTTNIDTVVSVGGGPGGGTISGLKSFVRHRSTFLWNELAAWGCLPLTTTESEIALLKVFPNPAKEKLTVTCKGEFHVTLSDIFGRVVFHSETTDLLEINTWNFSRGIYFVCVLPVNSRQEIVRKIVVE